MLFDPQTYQMHIEALEGGVFYRNELADSSYVRTYFPPRPHQKNYDREPHRSFPVTSDVINRVASLLHDGMSVECTNAAVSEILNGILERNQWPELSRQLLVNPLAVGGQLVTLKTSDSGVIFESWNAEYIWAQRYGDYEWYAIAYEVTKDGIKPLVKEPKPEDIKQQRVVVIPIDEISWGGVVHNFGFTPAVYFRSVDKDSELRYGLPFYLRFRQQLIDYNRVYSHGLKSLLILQAKWVANKSQQDPSVNFEVDVDEIAYVGENGELKQVGSELDLTNINSILDRLKSHISASAQVPDFMTGLTGVGKVESGVALQIVSAPLMELVNRIRGEYKLKVNELLTKAIMAEYALMGKRPPAFELEISLAENILPVDESAKAQMILSAIEKGIITPQEAREVYLHLIGLEYLLENSASQVA